MHSPHRPVWSLVVAATAALTAGGTAAVAEAAPPGPAVGTPAASSLVAAPDAAAPTTLTIAAAPAVTVDAPAATAAAVPSVAAAADLVADPACGGLLRLAGTSLCAHGEDDDRAHTAYAAEARASGTAAGEHPVTCDDGASGPRVQAVYVVPGTAPDRLDELAPRIRSWAAAVDRIVADSAGGRRSVRWALEGGCRIAIARVRLSADATASFGTTIQELARAGFDRADRRYLVWFDAETYCGIATLWSDDRADDTNRNNGGTAAYGRIDRRCWGGGVEAHELVHMLGGVQRSAPNATAAGHCHDEWDLLCYADGHGVHMNHVCPSAEERLLDCNRDDYFNVDPAPGSYLATHWNVARSSFLHGSPPPAPDVEHRVEGELSSSQRSQRRPVDAGAGPLSVRIEHPTGTSENVATTAVAVGGGALVTATRGGDVVTSAPATWRVRLLDADGEVVAQRSGTSGTIELQLPAVAAARYWVEVAADGSGPWRGVVTARRA